MSGVLAGASTTHLRCSTGGDDVLGAHHWLRHRRRHGPRRALGQHRRQLAARWTGRRTPQLIAAASDDLATGLSPTSADTPSPPSRPGVAFTSGDTVVSQSQTDEHLPPSRSSTRAATTSSGITTSAASAASRSRCRSPTWNTPAALRRGPDDRRLRSSSAASDDLATGPNTSSILAVRTIVAFWLAISRSSAIGRRLRLVFDPGGDGDLGITANATPAACSMSRCRRRGTAQRHGARTARRLRSSSPPPATTSTRSPGPRPPSDNVAETTTYLSGPAIEIGVATHTVVRS